MWGAVGGFGEVGVGGWVGMRWATPAGGLVCWVGHKRAPQCHPGMRPPRVASCLPALQSLLLTPLLLPAPAPVRLLLAPPPPLHNMVVAKLAV